MLGLRRSVTQRLLQQQRRSLHTNVIKTLRSRQFINAVTSDSIEKQTDKPVGVYCGVDPTADSLHLGNMVTLMGLLHFHLAGHHAIPLVGNATGMIGDPSGRSTERVALGQDALAKNVDAIEKQLKRFFERGTQYAAKRVPGLEAEKLPKIEVARNADWYRDMNILGFLGTVGRYTRVGSMVARDSVKSRLASAQGISFTEFSYQLLQAYDFWYLYHHRNCRVQIGGSDQWGNITAGTELIHKMPRDDTDTGVVSEQGTGDEAFGLTIPLLTTASGEKFGKSAGNAVWLDEQKTSPFDVYQFFIKTSDADVAKFLKMFTLLPLERIGQVMEAHEKAPEKFTAQRLLAEEVTELIHGEAGVQQAKCATQVLFGSKDSTIEQFSASEIADAFANDRRMVDLHRDDAVGKQIAELAVLAGACSSKSQATRLARGGGLYWNNAPVADGKWVPGSDQFIGGGTIGVLRTGKTNYFIVRLV